MAGAVIAGQAWSLRPTVGAAGPGLAVGDVEPGLAVGAAGPGLFLVGGARGRQSHFWDFLTLIFLSNIYAILSQSSNISIQALAGKDEIGAGGISEAAPAVEFQPDRAADSPHFQPAEDPRRLL